MDGLGDASAAAEGATLASYAFDMKLKRECGGDDGAPRIEAQPAASGVDRAAWERGAADAESQNLARRLADTPANYMTPQRFCEAVEAEIGRRDVYGGRVEMEVLEEAAIQSLGMGCFWGVAKGSQEPPRLLILRHRGRSNDSTQDWDLGLVGKGVTFDTGGICLKPSKGMGEMKHDMAGAAAVVAATLGAARTRAACNLVAVVPLCENMPGGRALKPGDVLTSMAGLSVEVEDTDAEGRLILADALAYLQAEYGPKHLVDVATLTGAMCVAVGPYASGVYASTDALWDRIHSASQATGDLAWRMPLWARYDELLRSRIADLKNLGGRDGGANSAARFLQRFLPTGQSWAHIDIAPVMTAAEYFGAKNRATGQPTRLLIDLARTLAKE